MALYSIKELERLSGIKAHTIRIWEKRYNIISPNRTSTNIRSYCDDDLKKLLNISILNKNGYKISKIAALDIEKINEKVLELYSSQNESSNHIENLIVSMIELDDDKFERVFSNIILRLGFENSFVNVIFPFLEKTGVLWQTNLVKPMHEHFIGNLIRQKLIVAIDSIIEKPNDNATSFILFTPQDENYEIALLFHNYLIKKNKHKVIYLGKCTKVCDLKEISIEKNVDYFLSAFLYCESITCKQKYIEEFIETDNNKPLIFSSINYSDNTKPVSLKNLIEIKSVSGFNSFLKEL